MTDCEIVTVSKPLPQIAALNTFYAVGFCQKHQIELPLGAKECWAGELEKRIRALETALTTGQHEGE